MKKLLLLSMLALGVVACEVEATSTNELIKSIEQGSTLYTVSASGNTLVVEARGAQMQQIGVFLDTELIETLTIDDSTRLGDGGPQFDITVGDVGTINLVLTTIEGRSFDAGVVTGSLTGSYFRSPFQYMLPLN